MQRLKDMYARNASMHERDRPIQPQGVKQLLQVCCRTIALICIGSLGFAELSAIMMGRKEAASQSINPGQLQSPLKPQFS